MEISRSGGEIVMRTDKAELGRWPSIDVTIRPIDSTSFEFIAEADHLVFAPRDPAVFGASPLITIEIVERGRRRRRRAASQEPSIEEPTKLSRKERKERKAAAKAVRDETEATRSAGSSESTMHDPTVESPQASPVVEKHRATAADTESATPLVEPDGGQEMPSKGRHAGPWIRILDFARHHRLFSLERVPVDKSLRGEEHEHTWDHRVATPDGLASHVCTICGKIRF